MELLTEIRGAKVLKEVSLTGSCLRMGKPTAAPRKTKEVADAPWDRERQYLYNYNFFKHLYPITVLGDLRYLRDMFLQTCSSGTFLTDILLQMLFTGSDARRSLSRQSQGKGAAAHYRHLL